MADREKLIELLTDDIPHCDNELQYVDDERVERLADHLIANGVTIQRWIPVTERLPDGAKDGESADNVIVLTDDCEVTTGWLNHDTWWIIRGYNDYHTSYEKEKVTHWMPLPEAPKGE